MYLSTKWCLHGKLFDQIVVHMKKIINTKRLISSKEKVSSWKDGNEFTAKIETLQILKDSEGETFRGDVKGREKEHQEKLSSINLNLKDVIQRLKS